MNDDRVPLEKLRQRSQRALIDFLNVDLDLGFTFATTAEIEKGLDPPAYRQALAKANEALLTIRRFEGRIQDIEAWKSIHQRANELEQRISSL